MTIKQIDLHCTEGNSDKVYKATIQSQNGGFVVCFAYGRRGSSLTTGCKTPIPVAFEQASSIFGKLINEKLNKGYVETQNISNNDELVNFTLVKKEDCGYKPQLLNEIEEYDVDKYINDLEWCAQEKFDGENRLLIKKGESITGANKKGQIIALDPQLEYSLKQMPGDFIINGEAFSDVVQCFDLISMGDKPYIDRYHGLHKLIAQGDASTMCIYTAWSTYEKKTLYAKLIAENAEGIVFKRITSLYSPGRPSSGGNQLKFKFCATATVIAGHLNTGKRSVQMFMKDGGVLIPVGNVTIYPNQEIPEVNSFMEIKYLYAYPGGSLFQPVFLKLRTDCDENDCKIEQLKYKQVVA